MATAGLNQCKHGIDTSQAQHVPIVEEVMEDLEALAKPGSSPSRRVLRKVIPRMEKSLVRLSGNKNVNDGATRATEFFNAAATDTLMEGDPIGAQKVCEAGINLAGVSWETKTIGLNHPWQVRSRTKIATTQGLVRFLSDQIPCDCLKELKKNVKAEPKKGICLTCSVELPVSQLFCCSRCKLLSYCSQTCQHRHWPKHKEQCSVWEKAKSTS